MKEVQMPGSEKDLPGESLAGYKGKINPVTKATLRWDKDLIFVGSTEPGYDIEFDGNAQWGCKPTEALLLSLAACMAIDIVMILKKMRVQLASVKMDLVGERNPTPPQYYRAVEIVLYLGGKNLDPSKVDRAISLSKTTYCSVYNSLRRDLELKVRYELEELEPPVE
jgi:putative redox protein